MDRATVDVYEKNAEHWQATKSAGSLDRPARFTDQIRHDGVRADLGCGPGWHASALGEPLLALDASRAMLELVPGHAPNALRVQASVGALPLRRGCLVGAWADKVYMQLRMEEVPRALADLKRSLAISAHAHLRVTSERKTPASQHHGIAPMPDSNFPGRHFDYWSLQRLTDVLEGAGLLIDGIVDDGEEWLDAQVTNQRSLSDCVGPNMRLLVCGLNPSIRAADAGVGFVTPGNRFWPAALSAGIVSTDRDPIHALEIHGVGMTDLVKIASARADSISVDDYKVGAERLKRLVEWLRPNVICFVGLSGYRSAVDRTAQAGLQSQKFGGAITYVMPNTSGVNTHSSLADLTAHLAAAWRLGSINQP